MRQKPEYVIRRADLARLRAARWGVTRIAQLYGCHHTTVMGWLDKFGLPTKLPPIGPTPDQITQAIERGYP